MIRSEIERIARQHGVDESHIRGKTKEELLLNIDRWYSSLANHMVIQGDNLNRSNYLEKRDKLRKALNLLTD